GLPMTGIVDLFRSTGFVEHSCARTKDGQPYCWGRNTSSQLGYGWSNTGAPYALKVTNFSCGGLPNEQGISADGQPTVADLDAQGHSYSAAALAAAGFRSGAAAT